MDVIWFRAPTDADDSERDDGVDGTGDGAVDGAVDRGGILNACYNALDVHVIRGRADDTALDDGGRSMSYAELLTEVGAFAGVLEVLGVAAGDEVVALDLPPLTDTLVELGCARVGAVHRRDIAEVPALVVAGGAGSIGARDLGAVPVVTVDDTGELDWDTAMRAGRTQPAGCAEVPGDAVLRVVDGLPVRTAEHLVAVAAGVVVDPVLTPLMTGGPLVLERRS